MSQYRNGIINSTAATTILHLGFIPDRFTILNYTKTAAQTGVGFSEWIHNVVANDKALISTYAAGVPTVSLLASAGITGVSTGGVWTNTVFQIIGVSNANPGVVTLATGQGASVSNGMTVTISGIQGPTSQLNTGRYIISQKSGDTFKLFDTFGNSVDTSAMGTWAIPSTPAGLLYNGEIDVISYPPTAPVLDATTGQVITPGSPAGLQLDTGYAGVSLGTGVLGTAADVLYWEAFLSTPTAW